MRFGSNRDGFAEPLLDVAVHRLAQLRIDLVCNRHHTDSSVISSRLQRAKLRRIRLRKSEQKGTNRGISMVRSSTQGISHVALRVCNDLLDSLLGNEPRNVIRRLSRVLAARHRECRHAIHRFQATKKPLSLLRQYRAHGGSQRGKRGDLRVGCT
jgi:hypothetical protein